VIDERRGVEDTICMFIGLEIANIELGRLSERSEGGGKSFQSLLNKMNRYGTPVGDNVVSPISSPITESTTFNALPIIDKLFSSGARNGIRCITEVSVYRQFSKILKIKEMCRHRIAFSMTADDCLMYLGSSNFQKNIGKDAIYSDGGKEVKKLIPYKIG